MDNLPVDTVLIWRKTGGKYVVTEREKFADAEYVTLYGVRPGDRNKSAFMLPLERVQAMIAKGEFIIKPVR